MYRELYKAEELFPQFLYGESLTCLAPGALPGPTKLPSVFLSSLVSSYSTREQPPAGGQATIVSQGFWKLVCSMSNGAIE
jgi:hypothetical protein